jgi:sugar lactone lactonase YvrE
MTASLILNVKSQLGEGAIWNNIEKKLYWVDILGENFNVYDPITNDQITYPTGKMVGTVVPLGHQEVLLALQDGIIIMDLSLRKIEYKVKTYIHIQNQRFNDGKCDPQGRLWVGTLTVGKETPNNKLYCIDSDFSITEKMHGLTISNGLAWSLDSSAMYHIDTPTGEVTKHDFDKNTGAISNRQVIIRIPASMGYPDGMTIDSEGMLWIAIWDGFCVARYNPVTGNLLQKIDVPAPKVTSCAFGGENLDQLYITTARCDMTADELEQYPLSGGLFVADVKVKGVEAYSFSNY